MSHKHVPNDVIETILLMRDIYIAIRHEPCYEFSEWNIVGIFHTLKEAKDRVIAHACTNSINCTVYDPSKRFQLKSHGFLEERKTWEDTWQYTLGVSNYRIEVWKPASKQPDETLFFNLDAFIKRKISHERLSAYDVKELCRQWKEMPPHEDFAVCFSARQDNSCQKIDRKEWYGHEDKDSI
jgi:hypothetical protein